MVTIDEIRRDNLSAICEEVGGVSALARLLNKNQSQISRLLNGSKLKSGKKRGMRSETARQIERASGKKEGGLDILHSENTAIEESPKTGASFLREFYKEFKKLPAPDKKIISIALIEFLDKEQT